MTIHQLAKPCFVLDPDPYDDDEMHPHSATWGEASEDLRTLREERGPHPEDLAELGPVKVKALPEPCWVAACNVCEEEFEDESGGNHFETVNEVEAVLGPYGWTYRGGDTDEFWPAPDAWTHLHAGEVFCPGCRPLDGKLPPPSPAELEAAGQLVLPGVLP